MKTIAVQVPNHITETEARANIERLFSPDWLSSWWSTQDIQDERPDLTDEQAREVLEMLDRRHDANIGINWEVIRIVAGMLFDEPEDEEELLECEDE